jgi:hypothetical protein
MKSIPKSRSNFIGKLEDEFLSDNELYVDKSLNKKIEDKISHLGKEKFISEVILKLDAKLKNKENGLQKKKILVLLIKLYRYNQQINETLKGELSDNKKLLNKRIKTRINSHNVHMDVYNKLLKIADSHLNIVSKHAKNHAPNKRYDRNYVIKIMYHKKKAETLYKTLSKKNVHWVMHRVLLKKLDQVYNELMTMTVELAEEIVDCAKLIKSGKKHNKSVTEIYHIIEDKVRFLRNFAFKYSYNIIHSGEFFDSKNNKMILVTKRL